MGSGTFPAKFAAPLKGNGAPHVSAQLALHHQRAAEVARSLERSTLHTRRRTQSPQRVRLGGAVPSASPHVTPLPSLLRLGETGAMTPPSHAKRLSRQPRVAGAAAPASVYQDLPCLGASGLALLSWRDAALWLSAEGVQIVWISTRSHEIAGGIAIDRAGSSDPPKNPARSGVTSYVHAPE